MLFTPVMLAALVGGFWAVADPLPVDMVLRHAQSALMPEKASGQIVLVDASWEDDPTVRSAEDDRLADARLIRALARYRPARVFIEKPYFQPTSRRADNAVAEALRTLPSRPVLASKGRHDPLSNTVELFDPVPIIASAGDVANTSVRFDTFGYSQLGMFRWSGEGTNRPTFSALMSERSGSADTLFVIDYRISPDTLPHASARSITRGIAAKDLLVGKTVLISGANTSSDSLPRMPVYGWRSQAELHALAAETLLRGRPLDVGGLPLLALILAVELILLFARHIRRYAAPIRLLVGAGTVVAAVTARLWLVNLEVGPALAVLITAASIAYWRHKKAKAEQTNARSKLPNMTGFRAHGPDGRAVIVARLGRFDETIAAVPAELQGAFARAVATRLSAGEPDTTVFHDESGHFAWRRDATSYEAIEDHLSGLRALFAAPVDLDGQAIDLSVTFGVDLMFDNTQADRLTSAIDAAADAAERGRVSQTFGEERAEQARWTASLHSAIDAALSREEIWVAYQPKLRLNDNCVVGAEALVRWSHPQRGNIAPDQFVAHAERDERIDSLTWAVLDRALATTALLNAEGQPLHMAVNLSAVMLTRPDLTERVMARLATHCLPAKILTLELTETVPLDESPTALDNLIRLRSAGVRISLDDYGTGSSNLLYLRNVPADEVKIDRAFVTGIATSRADRAIVRGTVAMAHEMGQSVVVEGVEDVATLPLLRDLGCDTAQGYGIGRPQRLSDFRRLFCDRDDRRFLPLAGNLKLG